MANQALAFSQNLTLAAVEFDKFMAVFETDVQKQSANITSIAFAEMDNSELDSAFTEKDALKESNDTVQGLIDLFRPKAHEIFNDAALNQNGTYYIFDDDRKLWHLPNHSFEKYLINGSKRNQKIMGDKLLEAWVEVNKADSSSLQKRYFNFRASIQSLKNGLGETVKRIRKPFANTQTAPKSPPLQSVHADLLVRPVRPIIARVRVVLMNLVGISAIIALATATFWISHKALYKDAEPVSSVDSVDPVSQVSQDKKSISYRLGKKVLLNDVNVYCTLY